MKFRKLIIENYKSFQFPTAIDFPQSESGKSIFLIGGMNGSGKTSVMEAINICLYGAKQDFIFKYINRKELSKGNAFASFELFMEAEDGEEIHVKRSWTASAIDNPKPRDLEERLVVVKGGKRVTVQNKDIFQDFINATIPKGITQFFFFDGEKIQEIAADDHSEVRLKSSLEAALGIQYISKLTSDVVYLKQEERKSFVEITDEEIDFKEAELRKYQGQLKRKKEEKEDLKAQLENFRSEYDNAKARFTATFNVEPESNDAIRQKEKKRIQLSNKLNQLENQVAGMVDKLLPFALAGTSFKGIKTQIEVEREAFKNATLRENASALAKEIVAVVDEPTPIYTNKLSDQQKKELESRIVKLLASNVTDPGFKRILNLADKDAAKVLTKIDEIENSDVFLLKTLLEEKQELHQEIKLLSEVGVVSGSSSSEKELFDQLQATMESCAMQVGRLTEQIKQIEDDVLQIEKKIKEIELEIGKLYEKHNLSKEKTDFLKECDAIANLLNAFVLKLRRNKIHMLPDRTFEMYKLLSSKSGLIKDLVINDDTYEITIKDRNGHEMKKSGLSAGEKEVFAVSLLWGLAQTSELKLPIVIDTPLSRLDSVHRDNIINNYFPNAAEQVIILSTDTEVDKNYYATLETHLSGAAMLQFDQTRELTTLKEGYFWKN